MDQRALGAEFIGTFTFVAAVCGAALFAAPAGGGLIAIATAAGLSVLAVACALGHVSGGHFNPAVTLGLVAGGRFPADKAPFYIVAQVLGGVAAAFVFSMILSGAPVGGAAAKWGSLAAISNTAGGPGQFSQVAAIGIEVVTTALLLVIIMGATSKRAPAGFAPIAIGLALSLFYLIAIPVSNGSLNPARSTATAMFAGGKAIADLWMFWVGPIVGAILGGLISKWLLSE